MKPPLRQKLNAEQVLYVLRSDKPGRVLADELGVSDSAIQKIRHGFSYKDVHPDEPRMAAYTKVKGISCKDCIHYNWDKCTMGFPEFREIGARAACACGTYRSALS